MNKTIIAATFLTFFSGLALAETGIYVGADLNANFQDNKIKDSSVNFDRAIKVGYDFSHKLKLPLRAEVAYNYRTEASKTFSDKDIIVNVNYKSDTLTLNGYYDFKNKTPVTPYITSGVGAAFNNLSEKVENIKVTGIGTSFVWNIGAGVDYEVYKNLTLGALVKYHYAPKSLESLESKVTNKFEGVSLDNKITFNNFDLGISIRYTF